MREALRGPGSEFFGVFALILLEMGNRSGPANEQSKREFPEYKLVVEST